MPAITIKNIPDDLYQVLKHAAAAHRRSINNEVIVCLEKALKRTELTPAQRLSRARALRKRVGVRATSGAEVDSAKQSGRP